MVDDFAVLNSMYEAFNARNIDGVLAFLAHDVTWANAMEGGHVQGHGAVRDYWTRQWRVVSPSVEPLRFDRIADGSIAVAVRQSVRDLQGRPLENQTHGLKDKVVFHVFRLQDAKVTRFDVQEDPPSGLPR